MTPRAGLEAVVSMAALDVRRRPDHRAELGSQLLMGERLRLLAPSPDRRWWRVEGLTDGYRGWVRAWGLVVVPPSRARAGSAPEPAVLEHARDRIGAPRPVSQDRTAGWPARMGSGPIPDAREPANRIDRARSRVARRSLPVGREDAAGFRLLGIHSAGARRAARCGGARRRRTISTRDVVAAEREVRARRPDLFRGQRGARGARRNRARRGLLRSLPTGGEDQLGRSVESFVRQ